MDDLSFRIGNRVLAIGVARPDWNAPAADRPLRFPHRRTGVVTGARRPSPSTATARHSGSRSPCRRRTPRGHLSGPGMRCHDADRRRLEPQIRQHRNIHARHLRRSPGRALRAGDTLTVGPDPGPHEERPNRDARAAIDEQPAIGHRWEVAVTEGRTAPRSSSRADMDTIVGTDYTIALQLRPHRFVSTAPTAVGAHRRRRSRPASVEHPRQRVLRWRTGLHRRHPDPARPRRTQPRRVRLSRHRGRRRPLEAGSDGTRRHGAVRARARRAAPSLRTIDADRRASFPLVLSSAGDGDDGVLSRFAAGDGTDVRRRAAAGRRRAGRIRPDDTGSGDARPRARPASTSARPGRRRPDRVDTGRALATGAVRSGGDPMREVGDPDRRADEQFTADRRPGGAEPHGAVAAVVGRPGHHEAIQRYMHGVRGDAPWCPSAISSSSAGSAGSPTSPEVYDTVFGAQYLVLGLGDVYLGAPVATPLDPRHRLVTTKYNPARTWTPRTPSASAGRTCASTGWRVPAATSSSDAPPRCGNHRHPAGSASFEPGTPWLLRYFDRIGFYPVSAAELAELRADYMAAGRGQVDITDGSFSMRDYTAFLTEHATQITEFRTRQGAAFAAERRKRGRGPASSPTPRPAERTGYSRAGQGTLTAGARASLPLVVRGMVPAATRSTSATGSAGARHGGADVGDHRCRSALSGAGRPFGDDHQTLAVGAGHRERGDVTGAHAGEASATSPRCPAGSGCVRRRPPVRSVR